MNIRANRVTEEESSLYHTEYQGDVRVVRLSEADLENASSEIGIIYGIMFQFGKS
jgi:hypothetical protein